MDWLALFDPTTPILETILRGSLIYLGVIVFLRLAGARETGSISVTDLVVILLISEAVATALNADDTTVTSGFVLVATVLGWSFILDALAYKFPWFQRILKPVKMPLIKDGVLNKRLMRREFLSRAEIEEELRLQGVKEIEDVSRAYLESNGKISAFEKPGEG